jgi:hypothetical protein
MIPAPRYRWFRFSLRTLFITVAGAAALLSWTTYSLTWIHERRYAHNVMGEQPWDVPRLVIGSKEGSAPGFLWLFGARGYDRIWVFFPGQTAHDEWVRHEDRLSDDQRNTLETIRRIFAEASVKFMPPCPGRSINDPAP